MTRGELGRTITVAILTISDRSSRGEREDKSGRILHQLVEKLPGTVAAYEIIPDEKEKIRERLIHYCDRAGVDLILTTGGTGLSPRDVTPEATREVIEREVPGMAEAMRWEGFKKTPMAILSRAVVGVRKKTLIITLPGSPKGAQESLEVLLPVIPHALETLTGTDTHCG